MRSMVDGACSMSRTLDDITLRNHSSPLSYKPLKPEKYARSAVESELRIGIGQPQ